MSAAFIILLNKFRNKVTIVSTPPTPAETYYLIDDDGNVLMDDDGSKLLDDTV